MGMTNDYEVAIEEGGYYGPDRNRNLWCQRLQYITVFDGAKV